MNSRNNDYVNFALFFNQFTVIKAKAMILRGQSHIKHTVLEHDSFRSDVNHGGGC